MRKSLLYNIYIYIYIITVLVVTKSLCEFVNKSLCGESSAIYIYIYIYIIIYIYI